MSEPTPLSAAAEAVMVREALARWGNTASLPPADGEVAELVRDPLINPPLQPISVSERLPEAGDCDEERCWLEEPCTATDPPAWILVHRVRVIERAASGRGRWLPAPALPLPIEDVK